MKTNDSQLEMFDPMSIPEVDFPTKYAEQALLHAKGDYGDAYKSLLTWIDGLEAKYQEETTAWEREAAHARTLFGELYTHKGKPNPPHKKIADCRLAMQVLSKMEQVEHKEEVQ